MVAAAGPPLRYQSPDEDSRRWLQFTFRVGDIVISTRSKHGTTWMQMICALLVFQTADLPAPLVQLSPWLDWLVLPQHEVLTSLRQQTHRRFLKTHTPLDGIPLDPQARYIVVGRHPLDAAVSLYHQGDNLDRRRIQQLTASPEPRTPPAPREALPDWLDAWIDRPADPCRDLDSLPGVMHHLCDAWARRNDTNIILVHYDDLAADLEGQMRRLAALLSIQVPEDRWPVLVSAAGFPAMRERADQLVPDPAGVLKDRCVLPPGQPRGRAGGVVQLAARPLPRPSRATRTVRPARLASPRREHQPTSRVVERQTGWTTVAWHRPP